MLARTALPLAAVSLLAACVTTTRVNPALYQVKTVAIASVYAKKTIEFENIAVAPMLADNELGIEVIELELGEIEGRLGEIFGSDVVPVGKAMEQKAYRDLPEVRHPEDWTQAVDMTAVDFESPAVAQALGALARKLGVDAALVMRHEWTLAQDRFELGDGITAFDRCEVLVVDAGGHVLWDDVVVARVPVVQLMAGAFSVGFNGATWADQARQVSRRASREALDMLERRYREGKRQES